MIHNAVSVKSIPNYGEGDNIHEWLNDEDHSQDLRIVFEKSSFCKVYYGGHNEKTSLEFVDAFSAIFDQPRLQLNGHTHSALKTCFADRPGQGTLNDINANKILLALGLATQETFETGLKKTVQLYLDNDEWVENFVSSQNKKRTDRNYGSRK